MRFGFSAYRVGTLVRFLLCSFFITYPIASGATHISSLLNIVFFIIIYLKLKLQ